MAHAHPTPRTYITVYIMLVILLIANVVIGMIPHARHPTIFTASVYFVAACKTALIVLFFMHIWYSTPLSWVFASAAFLWLGVMFALTLGDYLTRDVIIPSSLREPAQVPVAGFAEEHRPGGVYPASLSGPFHPTAEPAATVAPTTFPSERQQPFATPQSK